MSSRPWAEASTRYAAERYAWRPDRGGSGPGRLIRLTNPKTCVESNRWRGFLGLGASEVEADDQPATGVIAAEGAGQFLGEAEDKQGRAVRVDLQSAHHSALGGEGGGHGEQTGVGDPIDRRAVGIKLAFRSQVADALGPVIDPPESAGGIHGEVMHHQGLAALPWVVTKRNGLPAMRRTPMTWANPFSRPSSGNRQRSRVEPAARQPSPSRPC
jgi:hypothetical protein